MAQRTQKKVSRVARLSVTLPAEHHEALVRLAGQKRVSVAWMIRDAVEQYLVSDTPLFSEAGRRT